MRKIKIKLLDTETEEKQFYKLRHQVSTDELTWVDLEEFETDKSYEILGGQLVAGTRIIRHNFPWMFDSVFSHLLNEPVIKTLRQ